MKCANCRAEGADGARYCEECGALMPGATAAVAARRQAPRPEPSERFVDGRLAVASDVGLRHPTNQDRGLVLRRADGLELLAACDGVSSSADAEAASEAAVATMTRLFDRAPGGDPAGLARSLAVAADEAVRALPWTNHDPTAEPPETTIVVAVVAGTVAGLAWVGDSRAYLVKGTSARKVTEDDSWAEDMVRDGMPRETAMRDKRAHAITQCLGQPEEPPVPNVSTVDIGAGESLVLCTDGLWNHFDDVDAFGEVAGRAIGDGDAPAACRALVARANAAGGHDNVTVAMLMPA